MLESDGAVAAGTRAVRAAEEDGQVSLAPDGDLLVGRVARNGIEIATATTVWKQRPAEGGELERLVPGAAVNVNLRVLPEDGSEMRRELVARTFADVEQHEAWVGPATLELRAERAGAGAPARGARGRARARTACSTSRCRPGASSTATDARTCPLDAVAAIAFTAAEVGTPAEQCPVSVAGRVADQLRDLIRDGAYAPGARLVERAIARELGTSHIPVREALARLAEEGLVVRLPRRGARVAELSPRSLEEISSVRVVLEQLVCGRVLERWTAVRPGRALRLARRMTSAAERGSTKTVGELDVRFHETLWQLADHELLLEVAAGLRGRIERFLRAANAALAPEELRQHAPSHVELVELLAAGDEAAVAAAMRRHIEVGAERVARAGGIALLTLLARGPGSTDLPRPATQQVLDSWPAQPCRTSTTPPHPRPTTHRAGARRRPPSAEEHDG